MSTIKPVKTTNPKNKVKGVHVEPSIAEKKKLNGTTYAIEHHYDEKSK